jgi:hypothetical protein
MREAERHYERVHHGEEPPWLAHYSDESLAADLGRCLRDISEPGPATKLLTQAVHGIEPGQVRARGFFQTDLASAHLAGRDLEQAAALGRDALRTAAEVSSNLTLDRLRTLQRQAAPLRSASPHLADLDARITEFLTRSTRSQQDHNL